MPYRCLFDAWLHPYFTINYTFEARLATFFKSVAWLRPELNPIDALSMPRPVVAPLLYYKLHV